MSRRLVALFAAVCSIAGCASSATAPTDSPITASADTVVSLAGLRGVVVFDGNSLFQSRYGALPLPNYVWGFMAPPAALAMKNVAIGGQTTADMLSHVDAVVDRLAVPGQLNVVVAWGQSNDLYFGASADTTLARMARYAAGRRAKGFTIVTMTVLPRADQGLASGFELERQRVNAALRASDHLAYADLVVDIAADPVIGSAGAEFNTSLFQSVDRVHFTDGGASYVATRLAPPLSRLLAARK